MRGRARKTFISSRRLLKMASLGEPTHEFGRCPPRNLIYAAGPTSFTRNFGSIPTKDANLRSDALIYAAQEAERSILALRLPKDSPPTTSGYVHGADETLRAAEKLLAVSKSPTHLIEIISEQRNSPQYATLHRVFLQVISRLLDHANETALSEHRAVILESSLRMARRIHELGLPLHLPLHQRLMETFAKSGNLLFGETPARLVLEASSWSPFVTARTFSLSLCRLIESKQFSCAADLLKGMRGDYQLVEMDLQTVREVLLALQSAVEDITAAPSFTQDDSLSLSTYPGDLYGIIASLESFVQYIFQEETALLFDQLKLVDSLDEVQVANLIKQIYDEIDGSSHDEFDTNASATKVDTEKYSQEITTNSVLLSGFMDTKVRALMSALLDCKRGTDSNDSKSKRRFRSLGSIVDDESRQVFQAYAMIDEGSDSEWSDSDRTILPMDIMYSRRHIDEFPDITAQLVAFNKGIDIHFTDEYEGFLWARDYEEEMDMLTDSLAPDYQYDSDDPDDDGSGNADF